MQSHVHSRANTSPTQTSFILEIKQVIGILNEAPLSFPFPSEISFFQALVLSVLYAADMKSLEAFYMRYIMSLTDSMVPQHASVTNMDTITQQYFCLLYTSPSPRDGLLSRMPSSA